MRQLPCIKQYVLRYRMKDIVTITNTFEIMFYLKLRITTYNTDNTLYEILPHTHTHVQICMSLYIAVLRPFVHMYNTQYTHGVLLSPKVLVDIRRRMKHSVSIKPLQVPFQIMCTWDNTNHFQCIYKHSRTRNISKRSIHKIEDTS